LSTKKMSKYGFSEIVKRIMDFKGLDKEYKVADLLNMSRTTLSERKSRNSIPFDEILEFAESEGVFMEWILSGQGPKSKKEISVCEQSTPYIAKTVEIMKSLDEHTQADICRSAEKEKFIADLRQQKEDKEAG